MTGAEQMTQQEAFKKWMGLWVDASTHGVKTGFSEWFKAVNYWRYLGQTTRKTAKDGVSTLVTTMARDLRDEWSKWRSGEETLMEAVSTPSARMLSGLRFGQLVEQVGKPLFGAAEHTGEVELARNKTFKLSLIPPLNGAPKGALFHVGGVLPYGDPLFRLMPEISFFERFAERGIAVYAMELAGDANHLNYKDLTLDDVIDAIDEFSEIAFKDHGQKMTLEGYCGLGPQALAYVAARPEDADRKFDALALFVSPVDGRECKILSDAVRKMPQTMIDASFLLADLFGQYVGGDQLRLTQDLALGSAWQKTNLGSFLSGWRAPELATVNSSEELTLSQRRALVGAYWISPENGRRFPVPVDLARYSTRQFRDGVGSDGILPATYKGETLKLSRVFEETKLEVYGFYGAKDPLVPADTAAPLQAVGAERYHHVVHPIGHVGYILSPKVWSKEHVRALDPNPVDLLFAEEIEAREEVEEAELLEEGSNP